MLKTPTSIQRLLVSEVLQLSVNTGKKFEQCFCLLLFRDLHFTAIVIIYEGANNNSSVKFSYSPGNSPGAVAPRSGQSCSRPSRRPRGLSDVSPKRTPSVCCKSSADVIITENIDTLELLLILPAMNRFYSHFQSEYNPIYFTDQTVHFSNQWRSVHSIHYAVQWTSLFLSYTSLPKMSRLAILVSFLLSLTDVDVWTFNLQPSIAFCNSLFMILMHWSGQNLITTLKVLDAHQYFRCII